MFRLWKSLLCLCCSCCFYSVKADDLDFLSRAYLSDKKYAKNIEVKAYLVTRDQVATLFGNSNEEIVPKTNKELYRSKNGVFLLVRCKNKGNHLAFGVLDCRLPDRGAPMTIEIDTLPANNLIYDCVLYVDGSIDPNSATIPHIICEWKSLYTI